MASPNIFSRFLSMVRLYRAIAKDPRTSPFVKWLPWLSLIYVLWPLDILPDFAPVLGQIDDILMIPLLIWTAIQAAPTDVREKARKGVIDVEVKE